MPRSLHLKPQDLVVALRIATWRDRSWTQAELARSIHLSPAEVHQSLRRLEACHLYRRLPRKVDREALVEFLAGGLRHVFPAMLSGTGVGLPTAHSAAPLADKLLAEEEDTLVWPVASAPHALRGRILAPLHASVPRAAAEDPALYEVFALVDALRIGRARERALARAALAERLAA